mmetsp:Transcript_31818/g.109439  ORF Transcript_31818/g.109439 Transcript_31818/m.109439 type:complete len:240 (-) Transcript_31818:553-1272(-)
MEHEPCCQRPHFRIANGPRKTHFVRLLRLAAHKLGEGDAPAVAAAAKARREERAVAADDDDGVGLRAKAADGWAVEAAQLGEGPLRLQVRRRDARDDLFEEREVGPRVGRQRRTAPVAICRRRNVASSADAKDVHRALVRGRGEEPRFWAKGEREDDLGRVWSRHGLFPKTRRAVDAAPQLLLQSARVRREDAEQRALVRRRRQKRPVGGEGEHRDVALVRGDDRRLAQIIQLEAHVAL